MNARMIKQTVRILILLMMAGGFLRGTILAGERHWIGDGHGWPKNWNKPQNWSTVQGGPGGAGVPTDTDDVFVDGGAGLLQINVGAACRSFHQSLDSENTVLVGGTTLTVGDGGLTLSAGTLDASNGSTISVAGNWSSAGGVFVPGSYAVVLTGASPQSIEGPVAFNGLTILNPVGVSLITDVNVTGVLTLSGAVITTGSNALVLGSAASVLRQSGHVNGFLRKYAAAGAASLTFEIGDSSIYSPLDVIFSNVTAPGMLTARAIPGIHPEMAYSKVSQPRSARRYWTLASDEIGFDTYDATFNFVSGDVDSGIAADEFYVQQYDSQAWSTPDIGARTATSTEALHLLHFGDFCVGMLDTITIIATADAGGSISPSGTILIPHGSSQTFTASPDSENLLPEVYVDGAMVGILTSYTFTAVTENHSIHATFSRRDTIRISVRNQWNLVSVPLTVVDYSKSALFPAASGNIFAYGGAGYQSPSALVNGVGYWMKFPAPGVIPVVGARRMADSVHVSAGWNLIGSTSVPVPVSAIISVPAGLTTSTFFGYAGQYVAADTIQPGSAYWVKVPQAGILVLAAAGVPMPKNRINIVADGQMPPSPPAGDGPNFSRPDGSPLPDRFGLEQNYPNPFNPATDIRFQIPVDQFVTLRIYDVLGREVSTLVNETLPPGVYTRTWNPDGLSAGVYYYRLTAGEFQLVKKMNLVK